MRKDQDKRYDDVDDKDFTQENSLSMNLSLKSAWHLFLAMGIVLYICFHILSLVGDNGVRIYDLLGHPEVSKTSSKLWLKFLSLTIPADVIEVPIMAIMAACVLVSIYQILKAKMTIYNINFRFLEVKEGVVNQIVNQVDLVHIKDATLERPLIYRLLGLSRIVVISTDKTHPRLEIGGVDMVKGNNFLDFIRSNAYSSSTEYWIAKDRRRRNERPNKKEEEQLPLGRNVLPDADDGDDGGEQ